MKKLNILIVEDEILIAEMIGDYLKEFGHNILGIAVSYDEAITQFNLIKPDIILLDIRLYGEKSGIDFAKHLIEKGDTVPILYLSSQYDQRTLKFALDTNPYGYLTKPISKETLWTSIEAAYQLYLTKNPRHFNLEVFDGKKYHNLNIHDILFIKADHVYVNIFLMDGQQLNTRKSLKQLAEILEGTHMIQCHRSYLVNKHQIKSWNADSMKLSNGKIIPISRGKKYILDQIN
ncbi:MAG: response regulator transcription factor [Saprospiraceae bacterium]|nr:response regulator transcription factor [Candidatus Vicinibacter affinis]